MTASAQELAFAAKLRDLTRRGTAGVVVAAADASAYSKARADLVCQGAADDEAINSAISVVGSSGGRVVLTEGNYYLRERVEIVRSNVVLEGSGQRASVLKLEDGADTQMIYIASPDDVHGIQVRSLALDGNKDNQSDGADPNARAGIFVDGLAGGSVADLLLGDLYVTSCRGMGIACDGQTSARVTRPHFRDVIAIACGVSGAGYAADGVHVSFADDVDFRGVNCSFNTDTGVALDHVNGAVHHGTVARGNVSNQLTQARASDNIKFLGCTADGFNVGDFGIRTGKFDESSSGLSTYAKIIGCHILNCTTTGLHIEDHSVMVVRDTTWDNNGAPVAFVGTTAFIVNAGGNVGWSGATGGTATIASGQTSVTVTHNLGTSLTPALKNIIVTPTNLLGAATHFRITNPTATQFTIEVDQDPGTGGATFVWQVRMDV